jgi:hypothetical protein
MSILGRNYTGTFHSNARAHWLPETVYMAEAANRAYEGDGAAHRQYRMREVDSRSRTSGARNCHRRTTCGRTVRRSLVRSAQADGHTSGTERYEAQRVRVNRRACRGPEGARSGGVGLFRRRAPAL